MVNSYDEIFRVLQKGGYEGYVCSEYEGNRWVEDAQEVDSSSRSAASS